MAQQEVFRCYYDDGTILTSNECPAVNDGSHLIDTEYQIIEDVTSSNPFPWFLIIMALVYTFSDQRR